MQLTPQQWVRFRRLAHKKFENDISHRRWSLFFKDVNPRKPASGPEYGILSKCPSIFGNRLFWGQWKSAFHGGARRLRAWHWMDREEVEYSRSCQRVADGAKRLFRRWRWRHISTLPPLFAPAGGKKKTGFRGEKMAEVEYLPGYASQKG